ncbi:MAG TPA: hypothetical protein VF783_24415 [Terriglobales bacterium]
MATALAAGSVALAVAVDVGTLHPQGLGIDPHAVTRWIKSGHLTAKLRGTARTPQQNGNSYLVQEEDVRRFILEHPTDIDLRKVDQLWFLDVITNGLNLLRGGCVS